MPFVTNNTTRYELVQDYVRLFYKDIAQHPSRIKTPGGLLEVLDKWNEEYQTVLATKYCEWDTEEMRGKFEEVMDFLTGAFTRRRVSKEMLNKRIALIREADRIRVRNEKQALERRLLEGIDRKKDSQQ